MASGGDGDTAVDPPQGKHSDDLFVLSWPIGCPPGSAWTSMVSLVAPWFQVLALLLIVWEPHVDAAKTHTKDARTTPGLRGWRVFCAVRMHRGGGELKGMGWRGPRSCTCCLGRDFGCCQS